MRQSVKTTYLEMLAPAALRPSQTVPEELLLLRSSLPSPEFGRFLYSAIGGDWYWRERLAWTYTQWLQWLSRPEVETWVAHERGTPIGYFELELQHDTAVELKYFGLLARCAGRGLGGYLLTQAVDRAWHMNPGVRRVWVHTCTLDHPSALHNYLARGFSVYQEEEFEVDLPDIPPGPWPGALKPR